MNLRLIDICDMCGGELSVNSNPDLMVTNVVIDSRAVVDNTLFVAIKGENNDGHDYVVNVVTKYVAAGLVDKKSKLEILNLIYVEDTVKALGLLAHNYRQMFTLPIVGITGSNGKTTVKEMLKSICNVKFGEEQVLATTGNLNNHLGVPLTLLKLEAKHQVAIIEMGMNHSGELNYLSEIVRPTVAVVNNVMLAHAGFFNDLTDIAKAKGEIYNGLRANGLAYVNTNVPEHLIWLTQLEEYKTKYIKYGEEKTGYYLKKLSNHLENNNLRALADKMDHFYPHKSLHGDNIANEFTLLTPGGTIDIRLQILGEHNQKNALTAAVMALQIGCDLEEVKLGLECYHGYKGRLEQKKAFNGALIIDDTYNANPDSVRAAIKAIADLPRPHWFIFADLKELGKFEISSHEEIGKYAAANGIDRLITFGELAKIAVGTFKGESISFDVREDVVEYCLKNLMSHATLLVKGSNSMRLGEIVKELSVQSS